MKGLLVGFGLFWAGIFIIFGGMGLIAYLVQASGFNKYQVFPGVFLGMGTMIIIIAILMWRYG